MRTTRIEVSIPGERRYDVRVGSGVLDALGQHVRQALGERPASRAFVVTDDNVAPLYLQRAKDALSRAGFRVMDAVVPAGEGSKSLAVAGELWEAMASRDLTRDAAVVALGGGVVGDLAGFVGSAYMRGVRVVQAPTTLLSMVDSSVGGKTGVNLSAGKNLVGTFCQPAYVCADTGTLASLPAREWACGLGEVAKSAVIDSPGSFEWAVENAGALAAREDAATQEAVVRCVVFKAGVVARDQTESQGVRECLNYGHTLAHAVENLAGYGRFSHGAAVAEGMRFAARLAADVLDAPQGFVERQDALLDALGLPALDWSAPAEDMLALMKRDKKTRGGRVRFVLAREAGAWELVPVEDDAILKHLRRWEASKR